MKKLIAAFITGLLVTAAVAQPMHNHRYYGPSVPNGPVMRYYHNSNNWVAPVVGGVILGAVIARSIDNQPSIIVQSPVVQNQQYYSCTVQIYDNTTNTIRNEIMTCVK